MIGVAILLFAALLAACVCGGCVGFVVAKKWKSAGEEGVKNAANNIADAFPEVYICSTKQPSCFHMQSVCGGVALKPLAMCKHCSKKGVKVH